MEADVEKGKASASWPEFSARSKSGYAQYYATVQHERLPREVLDLMTRMKKVTQGRYAGGLAAQSDAIREQVEQTTLRNDLVVLENDQRITQARLNMLLARPASTPLAEPVQLDYASREDRVGAHNPQHFTCVPRSKLHFVRIVHHLEQCARHGNDIGRCFH